MIKLPATRKACAGLDRRDGEHARARADIEHAGRACALQLVGQRLEAAFRRAVMPCAERCGCLDPHRDLAAAHFRQLMCACDDERTCVDSGKAGQALRHPVLVVELLHGGASIGALALDDRCGLVPGALVEAERIEAPARLGYLLHRHGRSRRRIERGEDVGQALGLAAGQHAMDAIHGRSRRPDWDRAAYRRAWFGKLQPTRRRLPATPNSPRLCAILAGFPRQPARRRS